MLVSDECDQVYNSMENEIVTLKLLTQQMLLEVLSDEDNHNPYNDDLENYIILLGEALSVENPVLRLQNHVERVMPFYDDEQFKLHFKMKRTTFHSVLRLIARSLVRSTSGRKTIAPEKQFLIAIWKMTTPDSYRYICEKFKVGKATALTAVRRVTRALVKLASVFITWPKSNKVEVMTGFLSISGFPLVIGAINSTHINIKTPCDNPELYVNRKGHHSIQLQAICNHKWQFTHCVAGYVGSVHNQQIFRSSEVFNYLEDPEKFPNDSHLVGDATYTLHNNVMTPFHNNEHLTDRQKNYNVYHSSAHNIIKKAVESLKGRFQSLLTILDMERVDLIPEFIIACCVLHNICLLHNDFSSTDLRPLETHNVNLPSIERKDDDTGHVKRDAICNSIMRNT